MLRFVTSAVNRMSGGHSGDGSQLRSCPMGLDPSPASPINPKGPQTEPVTSTKHQQDGFDEHVFLIGRPPLSEFLGFVRLLSVEGQRVSQRQLADEWPRPTITFATSRKQKRDGRTTQ